MRQLTLCVLGMFGATPGFLDGPFSKPALDERLATCADGSHSHGNRQRRATINGLVRPYRAVYLTSVFCHETELHLVVGVNNGLYSVRVASGRDRFGALLLRDDVPGGSPEVRLVVGDQTIWVGVGPSGRPSLATTTSGTVWP